MKRLKQLEIPAPIADTNDYEAKYHGKTISDPYHWLKDDRYPEIGEGPVLDYLKEENAYYQAFLKPHRKLVDKVFEEFKGRTDEKETSVPYVENGYEYRWFFNEGSEYRTRARKKLNTGEEEIFLDENQLAEGQDYFVLGDWDISPDNRILAYGFDTDGDERYEVNFVDLSTGEKLTDQLNDVGGGILFSSDGSKLMYAKLEADRWHAKNILVHTIGTSQSEDKVIYHEEDDGYFIDFELTSSREYILIDSTQGEISETHYLSADFSDLPQLIVPRESAFSQQIDHAHGDFYILANDTHKNFRFAKVSDQDPSPENWQTIIEGSDDTYLMGLVTFDSFIALHRRNKGYETLSIRDYEGNSEEIPFPESIFSLGLGMNTEFHQSHLRVHYQSMITPETVFDYDIKTKGLTTRKVKNIPSGYDKTQYETKRLMAPTRDGKQVPISIVYKKRIRSGWQSTGMALWLRSLCLYHHPALFSRPPERSGSRFCVCNSSCSRRHHAWL